jgi:glycosyltransferase involved in cell wall biosynthesis
MIGRMQVIAFTRGVERLVGVNLAWVDAVFQAAGVAGLLLAGLLPGWRWLPVSFVGLLLPLGFQYDIGVLERWRQIAQAFPLFAFAACLPAARLADLVRGRRALSPGRSGNPARVLMVTTHFIPRMGGAERQMLALASRLQRRGHAVRVATLRRRGEAARAEAGGIPVDRAIRSVGGGWLYAATYASSLAWYLWRRRGDYDVVHAHVVYLDAIVAGWLRRWTAKPVIAKGACSGPSGDAARLSRMPRRLALGGLHRVDTVVAVSRDVREELVRFGIPPERVVHIPNGVDTRRFAPVADRETLRQRMELRGRVAVFVGRLDAQKGVDILLAAWPRVAAALPDARLLIIGAGPDEAALRAQAAGLPAAARPVWCGERDDVAPYLQGADAVVLPSRAEGLSNALLEAMACGAACVASRIGGNDELIEDGRTGVLVPPNDAPALAQAMSRLLAAPDEARRLGLAARAAVEQDYAMDAVVERYASLYVALGEGMAAEQARAEAVPC